MPGTAAALAISRRTTTKDGPDQDEADERLATAADMLAVRAAFDRMLVRKGLVTGDQLDLIRHGTKSRAVVTGMRTTGAAREDHRERKGSPEDHHDRRYERRVAQTLDADEVHDERPEQEDDGEQDRLRDEASEPRALVGIEILVVAN